ncbi:MAG: prepilin-type N-terminal cleavage/methylation domain-containing protein [Phycisphaerae bacterium]
MMQKPDNMTRRKALTLVELLVTLTIIAAMILAFSTILASSQKVISSSQALMRSNAAAEAVARAIRLDFQAITKDGFLVIRDDEIAFTTAGYFPMQRVGSLSNDDEGTSDKVSGFGLGQVVIYGRCDNPAESSLSDPVLFRIPVVLNPEHFDSPPADAWKISPSYFLTKTADELADIAGSLISGAPSSIRVPSENTFASVEDLWMVMNHRVSDLEIAYAMEFQGGSLDWQTVSGGNEKVWTHHDRAAWPLAVRIRFKIHDKAWPDEFAEDALTYEVICSIGS